MQLLALRRRRGSSRLPTDVQTTPKGAVHRATAPLVGLTMESHNVERHGINHSDVKLIVAENVRRLLRFASEAPRRASLPATLLALERASGVDRKTIRRTINAESAIGVDNLARIAHAFGLDSWQLLVPGLDPANAPRIAMTAIPSVTRAASRRPSSR